MNTKGEFPLSFFNGRDLSAILTAYLEINQLKQLYRQGWLKRGIPVERCESVADHVFSMTLLAWWVADALYQDVDLHKILRMTLLHELGEVYIGDLIPADRISAEKKHQMERAAFKQVVSKLERAEEYIQLWEEYETNQTVEARLVKQLDRLEMACQALVYEKQGFEHMQEFFDSTHQWLEEPRLQSIFSEIINLRT